MGVVNGVWWRGDDVWWRGDGVWWRGDDVLMVRGIGILIFVVFLLLYRI